MDALMLPSNWQKVRLGDIFFITAGGDLSKPHYSNTKQSDFNYPIYSNAIEKKGLYGYSSFFIIKNKSITITSRGTIGVAFFRDYPYVPIGRLLVLQPKISNIDCRFYTEYINSKVKFNTEQTTIPQLTIPKVALCEILLPPLNEQIAIANILSDLDRYLCALRALILKKEGVKKALSFELLSQRKRLKGFNQAWQRVRLGDIGITINGLVGKTKQDFINGNAKYITFLNVLNNVIIDTSILENVKIYPNEKQNSFKKYDLFFNTSSETPKEVGMCAVLLDDIDQVFLNSFCFGFRIFDKAVDGLFLSYLINSEIGRKAFENLAQGSTRYNLSKSGFNNVCLSLPPLNEQSAIANILSALDKEIASLKNKKRQFENIKKTLNHDLMSAKIRVLKK
ncbi:restriction endonuclease subunit S [Helicobacter pylori]